MKAYQPYIKLKFQKKSHNYAEFFHRWSHIPILYRTVYKQDTYETLVPFIKMCIIFEPYKMSLAPIASYGVDVSKGV